MKKYTDTTAALQDFEKRIEQVRKWYKMDGMGRHYTQVMAELVALEGDIKVRTQLTKIVQNVRRDEAHPARDPGTTYTTISTLDIPKDIERRRGVIFFAWKNHKEEKGEPGVFDTCEKELLKYGLTNTVISETHRGVRLCGWHPKFECAPRDIAHKYKVYTPEDFMELVGLKNTESRKPPSSTIPKDIERRRGVVIFKNRELLKGSPRFDLCKETLAKYGHVRVEDSFEMCAQLICGLHPKFEVTEEGMECKRYDVKDFMELAGLGSGEQNPKLEKGDYFVGTEHVSFRGTKMFKVLQAQADSDSFAIGGEEQLWSRWRLPTIKELGAHLRLKDKEMAWWGYTHAELGDTRIDTPVGCVRRKCSDGVLECSSQFT